MENYHCLSIGTETEESTSETIEDWEYPRNLAFEVGIILWASTGSARYFTSSGITKSLPDSAAFAWDALKRAIDDRGLPPKVTLSFSRLSLTMFITYFRISSSTLTLETSA